jgi:hypothetical protein
MLDPQPISGISAGQKIYAETALRGSFARKSGDGFNAFDLSI